MFKIILWRLTYELLSLLKIAGVRGPSRFYFAFGANLNPEVLRKRRIDVLSSRLVQLENFRLRFNHDVPFRKVGFASIEAYEGARVLGLLYEVPWIDEMRMDYFESNLFLKRYLKQKCVIDGEASFFYSTGRSKGHGRPLREYRDKVLKAYSLYFDPETPEIKKLKHIECVAEPKDRWPVSFLISKYDCCGYFLRHQLMEYDALCFRLFKFFIFRDSLFQKYIPQTHLKLPESYQESAGRVEIRRAA